MSSNGTQAFFVEGIHNGTNHPWQNVHQLNHVLDPALPIPDVDQGAPFERKMMDPRIHFLGFTIETQWLTMVYGGHTHYGVKIHQKHNWRALTAHHVFLPSHPSRKGQQLVRRALCRAARLGRLWWLDLCRRLRVATGTADFAAGRDGPF